MSAEAEASTWLSVPERGALLGIRVMFAVTTLFGRWPAQQIARLVAWYYYLRDDNARRASRDWLRRIHGAEPRRRDVYQHILRFCRVTVDRVFLLQDKTRYFRFTRTGHHYLEALKAQKQGAVLLGAHLGSYEAMRLGGDEDDVPINILAYLQNAKMVNELFERLSPGRAARVIHIEPDSVHFMFTAKQRIAAGELVAIHGDRVGLNERSVEVQFFGAPARFATGPFLLASVLRCPVYLTFGLYHEPNRYDLYCEPFVERVELPRGNRNEALQELVQRYAARLEEYCRKAPDNWFNFYDFWGGPKEEGA